MLPSQKALIGLIIVIGLISFIVLVVGGVRV